MATRPVSSAGSVRKLSIAWRSTIAATAATTMIHPPPAMQIQRPRLLRRDLAGREQPADNRATGRSPIDVLERVIRVNPIAAAKISQCRTRLVCIAWKKKEHCRDRRDGAGNVLVVVKASPISHQLLDRIRPANARPDARSRIERQLTTRMAARTVRRTVTARSVPSDWMLIIAESATTISSAARRKVMIGGRGPQRSSADTSRAGARATAAPHADHARRVLGTARERDQPKIPT